jgi:hypothetical protein
MKAFSPRQRTKAFNLNERPRMKAPKHNVRKTLNLTRRIKASNRHRRTRASRESQRTRDSSRNERPRMRATQRNVKKTLNRTRRIRASNRHRENRASNKAGLPIRQSLRIRVFSRRIVDISRGQRTRGFSSKTSVVTPRRTVNSPQSRYGEECGSRALRMTLCMEHAYLFAF